MLLGLYLSTYSKEPKRLNGELAEAERYIPR